MIRQVDQITALRHAESERKRRAEVEANHRARLIRAGLFTDCDRCSGLGWVRSAAGQTIPCPACQEPEAPVCPCCGGMGMVLVRSSDTAYDTTSGTLHPCALDCAAAQRLAADRFERMREYARLPIEYAECSLDKFDRLPQKFKVGKLAARVAVGLFVETPDHYMRAGDIPAEWHAAQDPDETRNSLILTGLHGLGKTGLAAAAVNKLVALGKPVMYTRQQDLFLAVQRRYDAGHTGEADLDAFARASAAAVLDEFKTVPILIVDEVHTEATPDKRSLFEAITRARHAAHLPTIWTTNHDLATLERAWGVTTLTVMQASAWTITVTGRPLRAAAAIATDSIKKGSQ